MPDGKITQEMADAYAQAAAPAAVGDNSMARLYELADQQLKAERAVAEAEEALRKAKEKLAAIQDRDLPAELDGLGMEEFTTKDGLRIYLETKIRASLSEERLAPGVQWLRENGKQSLIKNVVSVEFGMGEEKKAKELLKRLQRSVRGYLFKNKISVHAGSLTAFVKEALANGVDIPMELLGVFRQTQSFIERPGEVKSKKAKKAALADGPAPF